MTPTVAPQDRVFDRVPSTDARSAQYPIRAALAAHVEPRLKTWTPGLVTDQGQEGACVGHGVTADLQASPARVQLGRGWKSPADSRQPSEFATDLYGLAKTLDEWEGTNYDGTTVLAGMKAAQTLGYIGEYRWADSVDDIRDTLVSHGPVVLGIVWKDGMYETQKGGRLLATGAVVGGHCIMAYGYNPDFLVAGKRTEIIRLQNSWGTSWGVKGRGYMTLEDFAEVFAQDGEAAVPLVRYARPTLPTAAGAA